MGNFLKLWGLLRIWILSIVQSWKLIHSLAEDTFVCSWFLRDLFRVLFHKSAFTPLIEGKVYFKVLFWRSVSGDERSDDNQHDQFGHFFYRFLGLIICIYVIVNGTTNTFPTTTQSKNSLTLWVRVIIFGLLNDYKWIFLPKINSFVIYLKQVSCILLSFENHYIGRNSSFAMYIRCLMVSTDQADSRCFYFRISWILREWCWFYFFRPLHLVQGLRSNNIN